MFKTALVPVDIEVPGSWKLTLPVAEEFADRWGTEIHAVTVVPAFGMALVGSHFPKDYETKVVAEAEKRLRAAIADGAERPERVHCHVREGRIYAEILAAASELGADLVLMTAHRPELKDYLLGPNAARIVRHAPQSVFVIREQG
ncbi:MAG: universal stress protein [Pikeienuella sp.]